MNRIVDIVGNNTEYMALSLFAILIAIIVTLILATISKQLKFVKYIPGIVLIFIGVFVLFSVIGDLFNPAHVNSIAIFMIGCASGVVSLLVALIVGIIQK
ncbi:cytochrome C biosynthesis protein [Peptoniphilus equinus]|uniref:Cytochrome C biosynthesis protein n=1 Tax=Peptoniphilus equinus TaxID=3016343 RepID=A0ABY7QTC6_9FIRM|nr:cytochrome C biosynthesis protein [Peptoniphilus equinus]WBW49240.1 cytochrome C biosynthesis protein [Peptoniphilus equinus]